MELLIVLVTLYYMVTKHLDQVNLQKKAFHLVYGFQGLEFIVAKEQLRAHTLIHCHEAERQRGGHTGNDITF